MRRLLTPDGLRVLVARKLDSLRGGRRDQCANGDLSNLSGIGRFQAFIDRRDGFDDDIAVKVYLDCQQGHDFTYLRVVIDSAKYEFSVNYIPRRNEHEDRQGEEHDEDEISNFLENHGMTWRLCEDFDKASPGDRRFQSFLAGFCPTCGRRQERKQPIPFCTPELHAMLVKQTGGKVASKIDDV
ncbi:hypothetical protein ABBQ32_007934 [Trebouxia sp. C0010 RCD-2024]